jgi:hypothetical protein
MARRKPKRRQRDRNVYYVVEIETWDWSYSFGLDKTRHRDEPYGEYRHLKIKGKLIRPQQIKTDSVEVTFLPDVRLKQEARGRDEPRCVGSLHRERAALHALLSMPADALEPILQMFIAGRMRYVVMNGTPFHYREALVEHYSVESNYDPDDLPPDEG